MSIILLAVNDAFPAECASCILIGLRVRGDQVGREAISVILSPLARQDLLFQRDIHILLISTTPLLSRL